jgi:hypothetical protein
VRKIVYDLLGVIGLIFGCGLLFVLYSTFPQIADYLERNTPWPYRAQSYKVTYYCDGGEYDRDWASITWINDYRETEIGDYSMPFRVTYNFHFGDHVQITARSGGSFTLRCGIDIDGHDWKSAESSGQDVVVECSGTVGHK